MDVKLKDILKVIDTSQAIQFSFNNGECAFPTYNDIPNYNEYYVTDITTGNDILILRVNEEI